MPFETIYSTAGGDIRPARFVKLSTAADNTVLEADANEVTFGISSEATQDAPLPGASALAAAADDPLAIHPIGSVCLLEIGTGGVTRGAYIKSDADGKGVLAATTGATAQSVGAVALESASENEFCRVLVLHLPKFYPALS
jgi:hypothetical protein